MTRQPRIEFLYCNQCRWLLRTAWMAQELLTTFPAEIGEVAMIPGTGGVFEIRVNDELLWSRKEQGRFPDIKELKQLGARQDRPGTRPGPQREAGGSLTPGLRVSYPHDRIEYETARLNSIPVRIHDASQ